MPTKASYPLDQSPLYKLRNRAKLARLIGVPPLVLPALCSGEGRYREFDIEKEGGGVRRIENPSRPLKLAQAKIARLLARIEPSDYLFCPVKGRCYVTNAAAHRGNRVVQCLDIKKFFPSTPRRRVFWFFHKIMKCESDIAGRLANLACYEGRLPTGSPLSPIMAYFAYYDLWKEIDGFCKARGFVFTVYIDDVTISGHRVSGHDIWQIKQIIHRFGLRYHKEKMFVERAAEVTGVILKNGSVIAPFRQHKKLHEARAALIEASDENRHALLGRFAGVRGQIRQIAARN